MATWLHADLDGAPMVFISEAGANAKATAILESRPAMRCEVRHYYIRGEMIGYVIRCNCNVQQQQEEFAQ